VNLLSGPPVADDRDRTGVVVVIESAIQHGEETSVKENIIAGQRDDSRGIRDKIKDPRSLTVVLVAKLDLHSQRLPLKRDVILFFDFSNIVPIRHYIGSLATRPAYSMRSSAISISRKDVSTGPRVCLCPSIISVPHNLACNESICDVMAAKRPSG